MPKPELIERVRQVQTELGKTQPTPATRDEIERMRQTIELAVKQPEHANLRSLHERIERVASGFEAAHPKLATLLNGLATELAAAGL
ncbi:MAG: hypothetical protein JWO36_741 [Myxococcales bacterium]|nr:hypothetical protein [Myxococcales bacterium]